MTFYFSSFAGRLLAFFKSPHPGPLLTGEGEFEK